MIFTPENCQKILAGKKSQTRRPTKLSDSYCRRDGTFAVGKETIYSVWDVNWRLKYKVGQTYAIQPGRGKKAVGRIKLMDIRREKLQDITPLDAIEEGIKPHLFIFAMEHGDLGDLLYDDTNCVPEFRAEWDNIYKHKPDLQWDSDPWVLVLHFRFVEKAA